MAFSIGGMISGLDTATMINQLMQLEARPQSLLKNKVSSTQTLVSALQALNTRIADLGKIAAETGKAKALDIYSGNEQLGQSLGDYRRGRFRGRRSTLKSSNLPRHRFLFPRCSATGLNQRPS